MIKKLSVLSLFAIILITTSIIKLFNVPVHYIVDAYEDMAHKIIGWIAPNLFTDIYPSSVRMLALYIPIVFIVMMIMMITYIAISIMRYKKKCKEKSISNQLIIGSEYENYHR